MAYADQQMSGNRIVAIVIVVLIHAAIGYALVTGLAYEAISKVVKKVTTVDIKDEPKPPPPPPPPPDSKLPPPPPIVAPPPPINVSVAPPTVVTQATPPPVAPPAPVVVAVAPPAPVSTASACSPKNPVPKGNPANWVTTEDYPSRAQREGAQGTTGFRLSVGTDGRVTGCEINQSSGNSELDAATCTYASRRARFAPATDGECKISSGSYSNKVRWVIPKD